MGEVAIPGCTLWFTLTVWESLLRARHLFRPDEIVSALDVLPGMQVLARELPRTDDRRCENPHSIEPGGVTEWRFAYRIRSRLHPVSIARPRGWPWSRPRSPSDQCLGRSSRVFVGGVRFRDSALPFVTVERSPIDSSLYNSPTGAPLARA